MRFEEHGIFEVALEDNLLIVDGTGPFNEETVKRFKEALSTCIHELEEQTWGQIIILHDTSLFTPDAESVLIESLNYRKSKGLVASGVVVADVDCIGLVKEQMKRVYQKTELVYGFFDSIESAKVWHQELSH